MADVRNKIVSIALGHVAKNKAKLEVWHYAQVRPVKYGSPFPRTTDCSGSVGMYFFEAGAKDPSGFNYNGRTDVATLIARGHEITRDQVVPGDVVCYGPNEHTALAVKVYPNGDILTVSHGEEGDPSLVWCGTPKGPKLGHPADTRAVCYRRFPTASRPLAARIMAKLRPGKKA